MNLKFSIVLIKIFVARPVSQQGDSGPEQLPTLWLRSYDYDAVSVARFGEGAAYDPTRQIVDVYDFFATS
jgi:hypothetical protein